MTRQRPSLDVQSLDTGTEKTAMNVQSLDIESAKGTTFLDWMSACGLPTINAAANMLGVHRHTAEAMRSRELTKLERLAMAAVYHRIKPFDRT